MLDNTHVLTLLFPGHTHGGEVFPLMLISYFLNPYNVGLYKIDPYTHVYVSMGTMYGTVPVRVGTTMEITKIVLTSA